MHLYQGQSSLKVLQYSQRGNFKKLFLDFYEGEKILQRKVRSIIAKRDRGSIGMDLKKSPINLAKYKNNIFTILK